jgi:hypothetical protein
MAGYIGSKAVSVNTTSATITGDASIGGNVTLNDGSADVDFRVESDDETHAIFVNGGDDVVSFFTTTTVNAASGVVGPDGVSHYADGRTDISRASGQPLNLRRRTDDGIIANFYKEASGTTTNVGSIGTRSDAIYIGRGDTGISFTDNDDAVYPVSPSGLAIRDAAIDLGISNVRFKDLHLSGNVVVGTDGKGIDFSATGDNGVSTPSELLDDYEEGTWTPVLKFGGGVTGISYGTQIGYYTKVGNIVHTTMYISLNNKGSSTGDAQITGLPFTSGSGNRLSAGSISFNLVSFADFPMIVVTGGVTVISLRELQNDGTFDFLNEANFVNTSNMVFTLSYLV